MSPSPRIKGYPGSTYGDLEDQLLAIVLGDQGVQDSRELLALKLDCAHGRQLGVSLIAASWQRRAGGAAALMAAGEDIPSTTAPMTW